MLLPLRILHPLLHLLATGQPSPNENDLLVKRSCRKMSGCKEYSAQGLNSSTCDQMYLHKVYEHDDLFVKKKFNNWVHKVGIIIGQ